VGGGGLGAEMGGMRRGGFGGSWVSENHIRNI
jgi:hypothetical protein